MSSNQSFNPLISVIMPTFNQASFLKEAIDSVLGQDYTNWELIIIDNFSTDATTACIKSYQDDRIQSVQFANQGVIAAARNKGLGIARGEYIAFLDSDDLWQPDKLKKCVSLFMDGSQFISTSVRVFGQRVSPYISPFPGDEALKKPFTYLLNVGNFITTSTVVVKKDLIQKGFSENRDLITAEDLDLWLSLLVNPVIQAGFKFIDEPLTNYRIHSSNNSSKTSMHIESVVSVIRKWLPQAQENPNIIKETTARLWASA
jgi:glycosyltransferase involved in cell wall biosynthesis